MSYHSVQATAAEADTRVLSHDAVNNITFLRSLLNDAVSVY
jgi:hypothetical protein